MARPFEVEIVESPKQLEKALQHARTASNKERLQMLYWLKSGQVGSRQELAQRLGRDNATITRWVRKYKDAGLSALLEVKKAPGQTPIVDGVTLERLRQRLKNPQGFKSYGQIQQWLESECGRQVKYKTVYQLVRYRLKAKLKVPRPRSSKQDPDALSQFKKTFPPLSSSCKSGLVTASD